MKAISIAGLVLALTAGTNAQLLNLGYLGNLLKGTSTTQRPSATPTPLPLAPLNSTAISTPTAITPVSDTTGQAKPTTTSTGSTSSANSAANAIVNGILGSISNIVGGLLNNNTGIISPKVNTILDTLGIPSTKLVEAARLTTYCISSTSALKTCNSLQNTVTLCVEANNNCTTSATRGLLTSILDVDPCSTLR